MAVHIFSKTPMIGWGRGVNGLYAGPGPGTGRLIQEIQVASIKSREAQGWDSRGGKCGRGGTLMVRRREGTVRRT